MVCYLIKTSKKHNSTFAPSLDAADGFNVVMKSPCNILSPSLEFAFSSASQANYEITCNYCNFMGRYYYIDSWENNGPVWVAHCRVDVLATYRGAIGNSEQYLLRAASGYSQDIPDALFPTKVLPNIVRSACEDMLHSNGASYWATNFKSGCYVLGVLNGEESTTGSVCYYALNYLQFDALRAALMSGDDWFMDGVTDVSVGVMKSLVNPMQYITACYWLPLSTTYLEETGVCRARTAAEPNICFGFWDSGISAYVFTGISAVNSATITAPEHPDGSDFHNYAPYSRYYLYLPPLGYVAVDRNLNATTNGKTWNVVTDIDIPTGKGLWWIDGYPQKWECQIGVPINLSMASADYIGMAQSAVSAISGVVSSASRMDIGGAIKNGLSGVLSALDASLPQISSGGGNGSVIGINSDKPHLITAQYRESEVDVTRFGRPACFSAKISDSPGYNLCANATVEISGALKPEIEEIVDHLNRGFYYE